MRQVWSWFECTPQKTIIGCCEPSRGTVPPVALSPGGGQSVAQVRAVRGPQPTRAPVPSTYCVLSPKHLAADDDGMLYATHATSPRSRQTSQSTQLHTPPLDATGGRNQPLLHASSRSSSTDQDQNTAGETESGNRKIKTQKSSPQIPKANYSSLTSFLPGWHLGILDAISPRSLLWFFRRHLIARTHAPLNGRQDMRLMKCLSLFRDLPQPRERQETEEGQESDKANDDKTDKLSQAIEKSKLDTMRVKQLDYQVKDLV